MTSAWLYPGPRSGILVEEARGWRYECRDGALVEHRPGQPERVLAEPGQVSRVAVVDGADLPREALLAPRFGPQQFDQGLIVRADDQVVLAVPLGLLAPDSVREASQLRAVSGARRFAQGFGLALEHADENDVAGFRAASLHRGPVAARTRQVARAHLAAIAVGLVAGILYAGLVWRDGRFAENHPLPLGLLAVALLALTVDLVVRRRQFSRVTQPPPDEGRRTVGGPGPLTLQVGQDDVLVRGVTWEQWIPGPSRQGTRRCEHFDDAFVFVREEAAALVVPASMLDEKDLGDACHAVGIEVGRQRGTGLDAGTIMRTERADAKDALAGETAGAALGNGFMLTPMVTTFGALLLTGSALLDPERRPGPVELILGLLGIAVLVTQVALWWARRRWISSQAQGPSHA